MPDISPTSKRVLPETFSQYNRAQYQRIVELTQKAITKLEAEQYPVTLAAIVELTRKLDCEGKGISCPKTILRNPEAAELFHQHSPAYLERQKKAKKAKRKSKKVSSDTRAVYKGLRTSDLVQMVEDLKSQVVELKAQQEKLRSERDDAYRLRDEALQSNAQQLAALTKLVNYELPDRGDTANKQ